MGWDNWLTFIGIMVGTNVNNPMKFLSNHVSFVEIILNNVGDQINMDSTVLGNV